MGNKEIIRLIIYLFFPRFPMPLKKKKKCLYHPNRMTESLNLPTNNIMVISGLQVWVRSIGEGGRAAWIRDFVPKPRILSMY